MDTYADFRNSGYIQRKSVLYTTKKLQYLTIQLAVAVFLSVAGMVLIFCGFWVEPTGEIDNSVLVAYGEVSTFAGALFGVDYRYQLRIFKREEKKDENH